MSYERCMAAPSGCCEKACHCASCLNNSKEKCDYWNKTRSPVQNRSCFQCKFMVAKFLAVGCKRYEAN